MCFFKTDSFDTMLHTKIRVSELQILMSGLSVNNLCKWVLLTYTLHQSIEWGNSALPVPFTVIRVIIPLTRKMLVKSAWKAPLLVTIKPLLHCQHLRETQRFSQGAVHTGRRTPHRRHHVNKGHIVVNGRVHTDCKQQSKDLQFACKSAQAFCVN